MIMQNLNNVIEIIATLLCVHFVYGERFKFSYKMIIMICIDLLVNDLVNTYTFPSFSIIITYIILITYCINEFKCTPSEYMINSILTFIIISLLQILTMLPLIIFRVTEIVTVEVSLLLNIIDVVILLCLQKAVKLDKLKTYILSHDIISSSIIVVFCIFIAITLIFQKKAYSISAIFYIFLAVFCSLICILWYKWVQQREQARLKDLDLQLYAIYYHSFQELLEELRKQQHDYKNHIQAIYSQHYVCKSYEELVNAQKQYCEELSENDKFSGLLKTQNPIVAGFLYGKFLEAVKEHISIEYDISLSTKHFPFPQYIIIEVISILWDNATEAIESFQNKTVKIHITDENGSLLIEVTNEIDSTPLSEIMTYFDINKSSKGSNRGIGLAKIKSYSNMYKWRIEVNVNKIDNKDLLTISVHM